MRRKLKEFDQADYEDMIVILQETQLSIEAIADRYEMSQRTAYRWLKYARSDGWDVIKRGCNPTLYQLAVPKCRAS
jgi:transposase